MQIIQGYRQKSKFENPVLTYVANNPGPREPVQFTEIEKFAFKFEKLNVCKNVRDAALEHAKHVSIIRV